MPENKTLEEKLLVAEARTKWWASGAKILFPDEGKWKEKTSYASRRSVKIICERCHDIYEGTSIERRFCAFCNIERRKKTAAQS